MASHSPTDTGTARRYLGLVYAKIRKRFEVDTRSLAAFRIGLGLIILIDLIHRAPYIKLFYTDAGVYPRDLFEVTYTYFNVATIHDLSGALWFQRLLFVIAGLFAIAVILGYRTRLVMFISLLLLVSLQARNPAVLNGGDRLFRVLLVVGLVAPLGERWSIDAVRRGEARETVTSFGTAAVLAQPLAVFVSNAILKHQGDTWYSGEAVNIAFQNDVMTIHLGDLVAEFPTLLTIMNYGWVLLLSGSVLFLLVPVGRIRAVTTFAYIGAFTGMLLTMMVGLFPLLLTTAVLPYLPTVFWERVSDRVPDSWQARLPDATQLGPLGRPPIERRFRGGLETRGYDSVVSVVRASGWSFLTVVGALVFVWIVLFSAFDVTVHEPPEQLDHTMITQQDWGLYTPDPSDGYIWFISEARLADGSAVDAFGGEVTFDRPPDAANEYETFRHRKFKETVRASGRGPTDGLIAEHYAEWVCAQAQSNYDQEVVLVRVYQMYQPSPIDGTFEEPSRTELIMERCGD
jgi:hypothetical protein